VKITVAAVAVAVTVVAAVIVASAVERALHVLRQTTHGMNLLSCLL
jgi:ABC-type spermidine/putrescine transport system permease subunit II